MFMPQTPPRAILFEGKAPSFPATVTVWADLEPAELFGTSERSGLLPIFAPGQALETLANAQHGAVRFGSGGHLERVSFASTFFGIPIRVEEAKLLATWRCDSMSDLAGALRALELHVPALLAASVPAPVGLGRMEGTVGGSAFKYEFNAAVQFELFVEASRSFAAHMTDRLEALQELHAHGVDVRRLLSAHRWLLQARRLRYASVHPAEFLGERLSNLARAVEVLLDPSVDRLREKLQMLAVPEEVAEGLIVALVGVSDELIAQPAIQELAEEEHEMLYAFAERAEGGVSWLLDHVIEALRAGRFALEPVVSEGGSRTGVLGAIRRWRHVRHPPYQHKQRPA